MAGLNKRAIFNIIIGQAKGGVEIKNSVRRREVNSIEMFEKKRIFET